MEQTLKERLEEIIRNDGPMWRITYYSQLVSLMEAAYNLDREQWVDVKERLPEFGKYVLCYYPHGGINLMYHSLSYRDIPKDKFLADITFTHWRDLPKKP